MSLSLYDDPEFAKRYAEGAVQFVPSYRVMQRMAAQLIRESVGDTGTVLVLGAGGGLELEEFASRSPAWRFVGVEPADGMITAAQERLRQAGAADRVEWHRGEELLRAAGFTHVELFYAAMALRGWRATA